MDDDRVLRARSLFLPRNSNKSWLGCFCSIIQSPPPCWMVMDRLCAFLRYFRLLYKLPQGYFLIAPSAAATAHSYWRRDGWWHAGAAVHRLISGWVKWTAGATNNSNFNAINGLESLAHDSCKNEFLTFLFRQLDSAEFRPCNLIILWRNGGLQIKQNSSQYIFMLKIL